MAQIDTVLHYKSRVHSYERYFILLMNRYHEVVNYWQLDVISHVGIHICSGEHGMAQYCAPSGSHMSEYCRFHAARYNLIYLLVFTGIHRI